MMDELIASMVNRQQDKKIPDLDVRLESELFDKAIDEYVERFGENADRDERVPVSPKTKLYGPHNEHYGEMSLEPLEVARHWLGNDHLEGAYLFQIIKYLGRYRMKVPGKGGKTDLLKMRDYLNLLIGMKDEG